MNDELPLNFLVAPDAPVPARYRGIWQRTLLETPHLRDTDTTVFWLQTHHWHADIRIPAHRPDFSGVRSLADCDEVQLEWLARQQGFAGATQVDVAPSQEICRWHRLVDYQPARARPDAGFMQFGPKLLTETGVHASYLENWQQLPDSNNGFAVLQLLEPDGRPAVPTRVLFVAGSYVMHVRSRSACWPAETVPDMLLTKLVAAGHTALLDFEISFGSRTADGWDILHSTLPWLEGKSIAMRLNRLPGNRLEITVDGVLQQWKILEWNPP
jgi:hypothetical protein